GTLAAPIALLRVAVWRFSLSGPGGGDLPWADDTIGKAFTLVQARGADQPEGCPCREVGAEFAVIGQRLQGARLLDTVDTLVGDECPRPLLVVPGIVLDEEHLPRFVDRFAGLDQVEAAIEERLARPFHGMGT